MNTFQIKIKIRKGSCRPQGSPQSPWAGPGCGGRGRVTALGRGFSVSARTCATATLFGDGATHRGLAATLLLFEAQTHTLRCAPVWPNLQSAPQRDPKWFQFSAVTGADQLFPVVRRGRCSDSSHARRGCPRRPGPKQGQGSRAPAGAPPYCRGAGLSAPRLAHRRHPPSPQLQCLPATAFLAVLHLDVTAKVPLCTCLLYTSDAADDWLVV